MGEGSGPPLQCSCLENSMEGGAWWAAVHGVAKSRTRLSDFTFTFHFHALEKAMAPHSSVLAWRIPGTGEPGGLPSMGSHRVGHDWSNLAAAAAGYRRCLGYPPVTLRLDRFMIPRQPPNASIFIFLREGFSQDDIRPLCLQEHGSQAAGNGSLWEQPLAQDS